MGIVGNRSIDRKVAHASFEVFFNILERCRHVKFLVRVRAHNDRAANLKAVKASADLVKGHADLFNTFEDIALIITPRNPPTAKAHHAAQGGGMNAS